MREGAFDPDGSARGTIEVIVLRCKKKTSDVDPATKTAACPSDKDQKRDRTACKPKALQKPTAASPAPREMGMFNLFDGADDEGREVFVYSVPAQLDGPSERPDLRIETGRSDGKVWDSILGAYRPVSAGYVSQHHDPNTSSSSSVDFFGNPKNTPPWEHLSELYDARSHHDDDRELYKRPSPLNNPDYLPFAQTEVTDSWLRWQSQRKDRKNEKARVATPVLHFNDFGDVIAPPKAEPAYNAPVDDDEKRQDRRMGADDDQPDLRPSNYGYRAGTPRYNRGYGQARQTQHPRGFGNGYPPQQQQQYARTVYDNGYGREPPQYGSQHGSRREKQQKDGRDEAYDPRTLPTREHPHGAHYDSVIDGYIPNTPPEDRPSYHGRHASAHQYEASVRSKAHKDSDSIAYVKDELRELRNNPRRTRDYDAKLDRCIRRLEELQTQRNGEPQHLQCDRRDATSLDFAGHANARQQQQVQKPDNWAGYDNGYDQRIPSAAGASQGTPFIGQGWGAAEQKKMTDEDFLRGGAGTWANKTQADYAGNKPQQAGNNQAGGWENGATAWADAAKAWAPKAWVSTGGEQAKGWVDNNPAAPAGNGWGDNNTTPAAGDGWGFGSNKKTQAGGNGWNSNTKKSRAFHDGWNNNKNAGGDNGWNTDNNALANDGWANANTEKKSHKSHQHWGNESHKSKSHNSHEHWPADNKSAKAQTNVGWGATKVASNTGDRNNDAKPKPTSAAPSTPEADPKTYTTKPSGSNCKGLATPSEIDWARKPVRKPAITKPYWGKPSAAFGNLPPCPPPAAAKNRAPAIPRDPYKYDAAPAPRAASNMPEGVDHGVQRGRGADYVHGTSTPLYLDTFESPYAVFIFKYRAKEVIEQIVGRSIDREYGQTLERVEEARLRGMPREALVAEMLRKEREREKSATAGSAKAGSVGGDSKKEGGGGCGGCGADDEGGGCSGWGGAAAAVLASDCWEQVGSGQVQMGIW